MSNPRELRSVTYRTRTVIGGLVVTEGAEVTVEVETPEPEPPAPDVTIVNTDTGGTDSELVALVAGHGERLAVVETRVDELAARLPLVEVTAEVAQDMAGDALTEVHEVVEEAVEAVELAAEEATPETPPASDSDVGPDREHPWFAGRSIFKRAKADQ